MVDINETEVRRLYHDEGLSMRKVAAELGVPLATLSRFMKKHGIQSRNKAQAQNNYLRDNNHQMSGRKHTDETKQKISSSLGEFWDSLTEEESEALKAKIGSAWKNKWAAMSESERRTTMEELLNRARETQGNGSRLERFIAEQLRERGYTVEERTTHYLGGKDFEVDIALPKEMIAIEVDGPTHFLPIHGQEHLQKQQERDARKDEELNSLGYNVLRIRDNNGPLSQLRINRIVDAIKEIQESSGHDVWYVE